jgi:hypothetical protein
MPERLMKKLLPLFLLAVVGTSCSKDAKPPTYILNGVILHNTTKTHVEKVDVSVVFAKFTTAGYEPVTYTATTNAQGQFTVNITDVGNNRRQYYITTRKAGMVQVSDQIYPKFLYPPYKDTTFLDEATFVSMKCKVAPMTGTETSQFLVWEPMHPLDDRTDIEVSLETDKRVILGTLGSGTVVNVLDSFAWTDHTKVYVEQFIGTTTSKKTLVKKIVTLVPRDTTFIDLQ